MYDLSNLSTSYSLVHTIPSYYNNNIYTFLIILRFIHIFCVITCYFVDNSVYNVGIFVCIVHNTG